MSTYGLAPLDRLTAAIYFSRGSGTRLVWPGGSAHAPGLAPCPLGVVVRCARRFGTVSGARWILD